MTALSSIRFRVDFEKGHPLHPLFSGGKDTKMLITFCSASCPFPVCAPVKAPPAGNAHSARPIKKKSAERLLNQRIDNF